MQADVEGYVTTLFPWAPRDSARSAASAASASAPWFFLLLLFRFSRSALILTLLEANTFSMLFLLLTEAAAAALIHQLRHLLDSPMFKTLFFLTVVVSRYRLLLLEA